MKKPIKLYEIEELDIKVPKIGDFPQNEEEELEYKLKGKARKKRKNDRRTI